MKRPISAALLLTLPMVSPMPLAALPLGLLEATQDSAQGQRRELAKVGKRMLEAERDGNQERFEKLEDRLDVLMQKLGADGSHDEAVVLLRSVFKEFEPEALALLDMVMTHDPVLETQVRLQGLESAMEMFMMAMERYPTTDEGLQVLLTGGELGVPLISEYMGIDGWGQSFAYKAAGDASFELRSAGPDMVLGTQDDVLLGSERGGGPIHPGTLEPLGSLSAGDKLDKVVMAENAPIAACRLERGKESLVMVNGVEHAAFGNVRYPLISPSGNVVVYTAEDDGKKYLVVNGTKYGIAQLPMGGLRFIDHSDIFAAPIHTMAGGMQWTLGDGRWLETYSKKSFRPNVYPPVMSDEYDTLAVRAKHDGKWVVHDGGMTSEPSQWASQPAAVPGKRAVTYRYGDYDSTTVVVDGEIVGVHEWARNAVFSPDGSSYAYAISIGGQATEHFDAVSNLDPKEGSMAGILHGPAYSGGTYHVVFNRKIGPAFAFVEDPVFHRGGSEIAYAVELKDGKQAVYHSGTTSAGYKYVDSITFDRPGTTLAFIGTRDDLQYLVVDGEESSASKGIRSVIGGASRTFAYVSTHADGQEFLTMGWSSVGPFEDIDEVGFMPDGKTPFAQVRRGEKHGFIIGQEITRWFDEIESVVSTPEHPSPTYMARDGESWHVVTGKEVGPAFQGLQKPVVLADGRVVYVATSVEPQLEGSDGTPGATKETTHVVVDGQLQPNCIVRDSLEVSPDGFRAYYQADFDDGTERVVEVGGPSYAPREASVDFVMFDEDSRLIIKESGEDFARLIIDNVAQPAFEDLYIFSIRTTPSPLTAKVEMDGKSAFMSGSLMSPYFDHITDPIYSPDGRALACRGRSDETWRLVIGTWSSEGYDAVFAPRFTKDGKSVQCAVRRGLDLFRLTVHLGDIAW